MRPTPKALFPVHRDRPFRGRQAGCARTHRGVTLVEAVMAIAVLSVAASVLLLATEGVVETSQASYETMLADGLARQLLDEILTRQLDDRPLGTNETDRSQFAYVTDYAGYAERPVADQWGIAWERTDDAGGERPTEYWAPADLLSGLERRVDIAYVALDQPEQELSGNERSDTLRVRVTVMRHDPDGGVRELARQERLVTLSGVGGW